MRKGWIQELQVVDSLDILRNQRVLSSTALIPIPDYKRPTMLNSLRLEEELVQHSSSEFEEENSNKVQYPSIPSIEFEEIRCGENDLIAAQDFSITLPVILAPDNATLPNVDMTTNLKELIPTDNNDHNLASQVIEDHATKQPVEPA